MFKSYLLDDVCKSRNNNGNLIRVVAAIFVIISHGFVLVGYTTHNPLLKIFYQLGPLGLAMFFILSGFFISSSFINLKANVWHFLLNRFLRIWPGLIISLTLTSILLNILYNNFIHTGVITSSLKYIYSGILLMNTGLLGIHGVFVGKYIYPVINGSLWTINYECIMCCILAFIGVFNLVSTHSRISKIFWLTGLLLCGVAYSYQSNYSVITISSDFLPDFFKFALLFTIGVCFQIFKNKIKLHFLIFLSMFLLTISFLFFDMPITVLFYIALGYTIIWLCFVPQTLLFYNRLGDYSYGIYIYGWPVEQYLSQYFRNPFYLAAFTIVVSSAFAVISWNFIEKKALSLKYKNIKSPVSELKPFNFRQKMFCIIVLLILIFCLVKPPLFAPPWHSVKHQPIYEVENILSQRYSIST